MLSKLSADWSLGRMPQLLVRLSVAALIGRQPTKEEKEESEDEEIPRLTPLKIVGVEQTGNGVAVGAIAAAFPARILLRVASKHHVASDVLAIKEKLHADASIGIASTRCNRIAGFPVPRLSRDKTREGPGRKRIRVGPVAVNRGSLTHHAFPSDTDVVLLGLAWRPVDHHLPVLVEETLAARHAIQIALVRPAGVRDPTANDFARLVSPLAVLWREDPAFAIDLLDNWLLSCFKPAAELFKDPPDAISRRVFFSFLHVPCLLPRLFALRKRRAVTLLRSAFYHVSSFVV